MADTHIALVICSLSSDSIAVLQEDVRIRRMHVAQGETFNITIEGYRTANNGPLTATLRAYSAAKTRKMIKAYACGAAHPIRELQETPFDLHGDLDTAHVKLRPRIIHRHSSSSFTPCFGGACRLLHPDHRTRTWRQGNTQYRDSCSFPEV